MAISLKAERLAARLNHLHSFFSGHEYSPLVDETLFLIHPYSVFFLQKLDAITHKGIEMPYAYDDMLFAPIEEALSGRSHYLTREDLDI
jgi:hypothetical protein